MKKIIASAAAATTLMAGCSQEQSQAEFYPDDQVESLFVDTESCDAQIPEMGSEAYVQQVAYSHETTVVTDGVQYQNVTGMPECDYVDVVNSLTKLVYEGRYSESFAFANIFDAKTDGEDAKLLSIVTMHDNYTITSPAIFGDIVMRYVHGEEYTIDQLEENVAFIEEVFYDIADIGTVEHEFGYLLDLVVIDYEELTEILDGTDFAPQDNDYDEAQRA